MKLDRFQRLNSYVVVWTFRGPSCRRGRTPIRIPPGSGLFGTPPVPHGVHADHRRFDGTVDERCHTEHVISPVEVEMALSVRAQGRVIVAESPVFWRPLPGPTENITVLPACKLSVILNGTSWPTEVMLELNTTFPLATIPTTVPIPYWAPRNLPAMEYSPPAGAVNMRSEYWPRIPATSRNSFAKKSIFPSLTARPLLYSAEGDVPVLADDDNRYCAFGPLMPFCAVLS